MAFWLKINGKSSTVPNHSIQLEINRQMRIHKDPLHCRFLQKRKGKKNVLCSLKIFSEPILCMEITNYLFNFRMKVLEINVMTNASS